MCFTRYLGPVNNNIVNNNIVNNNIVGSFGAAPISHSGRRLGGAGSETTLLGLAAGDVADSTLALRP